jgi:hypothetical protein
MNSFIGKDSIIGIAVELNLFEALGKNPRRQPCQMRGNGALASEAKGLLIGQRSRPILPPFSGKRPHFPQHPQREWPSNAPFLPVVRGDFWGLFSVWARRSAQKGPYKAKRTKGERTKVGVQERRYPSLNAASICGKVSSMAPCSVATALAASVNACRAKKA